MAETLESRVSHIEQMNEAIYSALLLQNLKTKAEFDDVKARLSGLAAGFFEHKSMTERRLSAIAASIAEIKQEISALPRILAEMLDERGREAGGS